MTSFDTLLIIGTVLSGLLFGYFALMRQDSPPEKQRIITFWSDLFFTGLIILGLRLFFTAFPTFPPDQFFLLITIIAGGLYLYYVISLHGIESDKRKKIIIWRDIFLCFVFIFVFRGFFFDYFRIPSGSMLPTLVAGDVVLTDKNAYGYRLPVFNLRLSAGSDPERGDIIVFRKPRGEIFFIKRIVGLPGDVVRYDDHKTLSINGNPVAVTVLAANDDNTTRWQSQLENGNHEIMLDITPNLLFQPPDSDHCRLAQTRRGASLSCTIPPDHYFVLGDNRDHSNDSRFWGFVPRDNIVGPAFRVLFNYRHPQIRDGRWWKSLELSDD